MFYQVNRCILVVSGGSMKTVAEKSRKLLRKVFMVLGVAAISLVFQACYGMPMDWDWDDGYVPPQTEEEAEDE